MAVLLGVRADGLRDLAKDLRAADRKAPGRMARRLKAAGNIVADDAKRRASWSHRIPGSIRVTGGATSVSVRAGGEAAPDAYPWEAPDGRPVRHPTFGHGPWTAQTPRPYLRPALEANADRVAGEVTKVLDDFLYDASFR